MAVPEQIAPSSNTYLNAIQWGGWRWADESPSGTTTITYYLRDGQYRQTWQSFEEAAYRAALQTWANVANLTFREVFTYAEANFVEDLRAKASYLGFHEVPEDAALIDGTAWGEYVRNGDGWTAAGLLAGGYGFITLVHEIGHGLGLAHPHDNGGGSGVFPGVGSAFGDYGDNNLNQGIFTTMSYNDGWPTGPSGLPPTNDYGWQSGPMAFDIAAIQYLYGANMSYRTGNDTYVLPDVNAPGTFWSCIWDAGGTDRIVYHGTLGVIINLTAATLDNSPTGGGVPSYATGIHGGFTIANGVTIENASGGSSNDTITGNAAGNILAGNAGNDTLSGAAGNDTIDGGDGTDTAIFSGLFTDYDIVWDAGTSSYVLTASDGQDWVTGVEIFQFTDRTVAASDLLLPPPPSLAIAATDASKAEGNTGSTPFTFTVTRSGDTTGGSSATYTVTGSGANAANAADFTGVALPTGMVSFAAGETSKLVTINVAGDITAEVNEGFTVTLSAPSAGTTIATAAATGTIVDDDASGPLVFKLIDADNGQVIDQDVSDGVAPLDTSVFAGQLTLAGYAASGQTVSGPVTMTLTGNGVSYSKVENIAPYSLFGDDGGTTFGGSSIQPGVYTVSGNANGIPQSVSFTLQTIAQTPSLAIAATDASKAEGNTGSTPFTFTVTRSGDTTGGSSATYTVTGSGANAANAADFTGVALPTGMVSFAAGETSKLVTINVAGDITAEVNEGFTVTLSAPSAGTTIATAAATGTIVDDDASGPLVFKLIDADNGQVIDQDVSDGVAPLDTSVFAGQLTLAGYAASGQTVSGPVTMTLTGNGVSYSKVENIAPYSLFGDDGGTTFGGSSIQPGVYTVSGNANGIPQSVSFTLQTIAQTPSLAIAATDASKAEGNTGSTPFTFTVTRSGDTTGGSSATYTVTGSGANAANAADFTGVALPTGMVSFAAGETSKLVTINVAGDITAEVNEGFTVTLSAPSAGTTIATAAATGTIVDDDASGPLVFKLIDADNGQVIDQDVSDGVAPLDTSVFAGQLTLAGYAASGQTVSGPVTMTLTGNGVSYSKVENIAPYSLFGDDGGTTFGGSSIQPGVYTVSGNANGIPQSVSFTLQTIAQTPSLAIAATDASKAEGNTGSTPFTFTVTRSGDTTGGSSATYTVTGSGANAANAADFTGVALPTGMVSFAAGETSKLVTINVAGDITAEVNEGFTVTLSAPSAGTTIATAAATGTIVDDDASGPLVFKLIDADNGQVIDQDVSDGVAPLDTSVFAGQLTLAGYAASGQTVSGPVTMTLTGNGVSYSKVENIAPYSLFGDDGGTTFGGSSIQPGVYTVSGNANGIPQSVSFTLQTIAQTPSLAIAATDAGGSDTFVFVPGFGNDRINGFDANPTGGQDFLDISAFGITSFDFDARVARADVGADTLVTIDANPDQTIWLVGIDNAATVTQADFLL